MTKVPTPKVPATPPVTFVTDKAHKVNYSGPLWRIFRTESAHALGWNELRHFGPMPSMRFDPHPLPKGHYPFIGVMYTATTLVTVFGEVYQNYRTIDRKSGGPVLASWYPSRELQLLDLTSNWPVLNGASASMMMDDKSTTQVWAQAIADRLKDDIDGLYHLSSITSEPMVTLFSRTETIPAFPDRVAFSTPLASAAADGIINHVRKNLGYSSLLS